MTALAGFLDRHGALVRVRLARVRGSSPREVGAEMIVAATAQHGTIGGGRLEWMVLARAREMLESGALSDRMDVPLGPEIGQCCGGRVEIALTRMGRAERRAALERETAARAALPEVLIFGAGHVGRALAALMAQMPVRVLLIDPRAAELAQAAPGIPTRLTPLPEAAVDEAGPGSAYIVATHDHGLDFLCAGAALERGDAAYVGLIGSKTKRAKFDRWCREAGDGLATGALTCPIGAGGSRDKRPEVIAALVLAEVMTALTANPAAGAERGAAPPARPVTGEGLRREGPRA
ncbi:xanthine dehydrogenase accessory protein XdhC [Roseivivax sp. CAU 1761]